MMWKETTSATGIYNFDYTLQRLAIDPLNKLDRDQRWVEVPVELGEEKDKHIVRVRALGTTASPEFEISGDSREHKKELLSHIYELFQWSFDLTTVNKHFIGTNLEQLFYAHPGTPIVKDFQIYFSLMKGIIHQQLNMKFAHTLGKRFVQQFGEERDGVWFYPKPEKIASLPYDALRKLQFSQRKAEYVIDTSRQIVNRDLDLKELAKKSDSEVMDTLVKIRGVGPWTAENWLLFGLARADLLPKADIGIQNALKFYFNKEKKPAIPEIVEMSRDWSPFRSYASLTLWRSIE